MRASRSIKCCCCCCCCCFRCCFCSCQLLLVLQYTRQQCLVGKATGATDQHPAMQPSSSKHLLPSLSPSLSLPLTLSLSCFSRSATLISADYHHNCIALVCCCCQCCQCCYFTDNKNVNLLEFSLKTIYV